MVDDLDQPGSLAPMGAQPTGDSTTMGRPGPTAAAQTGAGQRLSQQLTVELLADDWEIDFADIKLGSRIGIGSYGEVYKGVWRHTEVAVKKLLEQEVSEQTMKELKRVRRIMTHSPYTLLHPPPFSLPISSAQEVAIMKRMRHPNIITFLGAVTKPPNMAIVTQYAARGSLFRMLHRCPVCRMSDWAAKISSQLATPSTAECRAVGRASTIAYGTRHCMWHALPGLMQATHRAPVCRAC